MKSRLLIAAILSVLFAGYAHAQQCAWQRQIGGPNAGDTISVTSVAVDSQDNILAAGFFMRSVDFGAGVVTAHGGAGFIARYSTSLALHWVHTIPGNVTVLALAVTATGDAVVTGRFVGTADFGGSVMSAVGPGDVFVARYAAADGHMLWASRWGGDGSDAGQTVRVAPDGSVLMSGYFTQAASFGGMSLISAGGSDIMLAKFSSSGAPIWSRSFGGAGSDTGTGVAVDAAGNVVMIGTFAMAADFGAGLVTATVGGLYGNDIVLAKYSPAGVHLWSHTYGANGDDSATAVASDSSGDVILTGYVRNIVDLGNGELIAMARGTIFLAKYAGSDGHAVWTRVYAADTVTGDSARAVAVRGDTIALTGGVNGAPDFGAGSLAGPVQYDTDMFIATFSGSGAGRWSQRAGGLFFDAGMSTAIDSHGSVVLAGSFRESVNLGCGLLSNVGNSDAVLVKLVVEIVPTVAPVLTATVAATAVPTVTPSRTSTTVHTVTPTATATATSTATRTQAPCNTAWDCGESDGCTVWACGRDGRCYSRQTQCDVGMICVANSQCATP